MAELAEPADTAEILCSSLKCVASALNDRSLIVVRLEVNHGAALVNSLNAVNALRLPFRVCLAIRGQYLPAANASIVVPEGVGLLLDDVDADSPLSHVAHPAIEALRFEPRFLRAADENMRLRCVLDSLLGLAQDIGLCTFGFTVQGHAISETLPRFDYVYPSMVA